jgi:hypothetical protein
MPQPLHVSVIQIVRVCPIDPLRAPASPEQSHHPSWCSDIPYMKIVDGNSVMPYLAISSVASGLMAGLVSLAVCRCHVALSTRFGHSDWEAHTLSALASAERKKATGMPIDFGKSGISIEKI